MNTEELTFEEYKLLRAIFKISEAAMDVLSEENCDAHLSNLFLSLKSKLGINNIID